MRGAGGRRSYSGRLRVGSSAATTGSSLEESLSSPRFKRLTAMISLGVSSSWEPL